MMDKLAISYHPILGASYYSTKLAEFDVYRHHSSQSIQDFIGECEQLVSHSDRSNWSLAQFFIDKKVNEYYETCAMYEGYEDAIVIAQIAGRAKELIIDKMLGDIEPNSLELSIRYGLQSFKNLLQKILMMVSNKD